MNLEIASRRTRFHISALSHASLVILFALVLSSPFVQMTGDLGEPYKVYRTSLYAVILICQAILIFLRGWRQSIRFYLTPCVGVLLWFAISMMWASHPELTAKRTLLVWTVYIVTISAACDLGYRRFIDILRAMLTVVLIINYCTVLIYPEIGIHSGPPHQWKGVLANKNIAGIVTAVTILMFSFDAKKINLVARISVISASVLFLFFTWSRTPLIATPIALAAGALISRVSIKQKHARTVRMVMLTLFAISMLTTVALTIQRDFLLSLTEDTGALSLRNAIWRPILLSYLDNPLLGTGYGSYWDAEINPQSTAAFGTQKWMGNVYQAHNGYLDILVQTGIIGFFLALYAAIIWPFTHLPNVSLVRKESSPIIFGTIVLFIIENFTETSLFSVDVFGNAIYFTCISLIQRLSIKSDGHLEKLVAPDGLK